MLQQRILAALAGAALALMLTACRQPPEALATVGSKVLTVADLDAYLLAQGEAERQAPAGVGREDWLEGKLRRLALERVFTASGEMASLAASPEVVAARERLRTHALASALLAELTRQAAPPAEEVAAKAEELAGKSRTEPILNFQHVFFRLDRVATDRVATDRGSDARAIRARAEAVAAEAQGDDADFVALAREHSDSANAAGGGLVSGVRSSDLDTASAGALTALAEGEVSGVVESRTGLHIFRLIRRLEPAPTTAAQFEASARNILGQERLTASRTELMEQLRQRAGDGPAGASGDESGDDQQLLAAEAARRGLETPEMSQRLERTDRLRLLERMFNGRRQAHDASLGEDRLRPFYDAQPSLFSTAEALHVELIFVPQGRDSFATQKRLEQRVAELRAGASFAALAREISEGPGAEDGGDLGQLTAQELARYGPQLASAVGELAVGDISDPIYCTGRVLTRDPHLLRGGFAILRVAERVPARQRSFEEATLDVRRAYAARHRRELDEELQNRILEEAGFELLRLPTADEFLQ